MATLDMNLARFIEQAPVAIAVLDPNLDYVMANSAWMQCVVGSTATCVEHKNFFSLHPVTDQQRLVFMAALDGSARGQEADRYIEADGSVRWMRWHTEPLRDDGDTIVGLLLTGEDITARMQIESDLRNSEAQFRAIFDLAGVGMGKAALDGRLLLINNKLCDILGYSREELLNRPFQNVTHQDDQANDALLSARLLAGDDAAYSTEKRFLKNTGEAVWVHNSIALVRKADGSPDYFIGVVEDIQRRKEQEETIFHYRAQLEAIFDNLSEGLVTLSCAGSLLYCNQSALAMCGEFPPLNAVFTTQEYEAFTLDGRPLPNAEKPLGQILRGQSVHSCELRIRSQGTERVYGFNGSLAKDRNGRPLLALLSITDMTQLRQAEWRNAAELERRVAERTAALQEANVTLDRLATQLRAACHTKTQFLASMSHELRTPLNVILGFAQLQELELCKPPDEQANYCSHIQEAGWQLYELINEVLDFAGIDEGMLQLSMETVGLNDVLNDCLKLITHRADARGINLRFNIDRGCHTNLRADRERLREAILHLLSNAIKYNSEQGKIVVDCRQSTSERLRITVEDTGRGLSAEQQAHLFEPFNRLGRETEHIEGTGIGLVITKNLVEAMGGAIGVDSTPGKGSRFWIELNCDLEATASTTSLHEVNAKPAKPFDRPSTILYVEDNPVNMLLVEKITKAQPGLQLLPATTATAGLEIAIRYRPDVILLDIGLPDMSGVDLMKLLRAAPETSHIPIWALSAHVAMGDIDSALAAGFDRYFTKPLRIEPFLGALDETLGHTLGDSSAG